MAGRILRWSGRAAGGLLALVTLAYSTVAISLAPRVDAWFSTAAACAWAAAVVALFLFVRPLRRAGLIWACAFAAFAAWWLSIPARGDREWQVDVSRPPRAEFSGDLVTVRDVRNFAWTGPDAAVPRWEDRTYDLSALDSVWFVVCYWGGGRAIAHTMLSFGFRDGRYLALSVETRKQAGEEFSAWRGSFKQFELFYVLADERDVFRVRTDHRGEELYLYPFVTASRERRRALLEEVLRGADRLAVEPQWYMTLGRNCTTELVRHLNLVVERPVGYHRYLLMNGYSDTLAYERGAIPHDRPFEEVRAAHRVTDIARSLGDDPDFSRKLREAMPATR